MGVDEDASGARQLAFGDQDSASSQYTRRDPEQSILHQVIRENWQTFAESAEAAGKTLPYYVIKEFESFLTCGVLAGGFVRLKCENCPHEVIAGFSCKKRGFCPRCSSKKMAEAGVFFTDHVFPRVPTRQWVLSVPIPLRHWTAANPKLMGSVLTITTRAITAYYKKKAASRGEKNGMTGAVTFIQRAGSSVNLNPHYHQLWMEGVFVPNPKDIKGRALYRWVPSPTDAEISEVLSTIRKRVMRLLIKRGYLKDDGAPADELPVMDQEPLLTEVMGASITQKIATGERAGQRVRKVGSWGHSDERPTREGPLCASLGGFSLHANVFIEQKKPEKFEKLVRYMARGSVANSRIYRDDNGDIGYMLKTPWSDGSYAVRFSPIEFIEKLVALIPPPRVHLTRLHGLLAPNHAWRSRVVPPRVETISDGNKVVPPQRRLSWHELLKRIFKIDLSICPLCSGKVRFIAAVMKRDVIVKILTHLGLPTALPEWGPARSPPALAFDF